MTPKHKDVFLYVLPIAIGLASFAWEQMYGALLFVPGVGLAATCVFVIAYRIVMHVTRKPGISAHAGGDSTPRSLRIRAVLSSLQKGHTLTIVARTCKRWLSMEMNESKEILSELRAAVDRGATVRFVLQDLRVKLEPFTSDERAKLEEHQRQAIEGFKHVCDKLDANVAHRLSLGFHPRPITNSRVVLEHDKRFVRLVQDISMGFQEKAFVVIRDQRLVNNLINELSALADTAKSFEEYFLDCGKEKIEECANECSHYLTVRNNAPDKLTDYSASRYLAETTGGVDLPSPLCIQLSITNSCTTTCTMCTHSLLGDDKSHDMTPEEIHRVIGWIRKLKTTNLLISGGEPLASPILKKVLDKFDPTLLGLGILSSGVNENNQPIDQALARILSDKCEWIQISVDSFDERLYQRIRGRPLSIVLETIRQLKDAGLKRMQICYTIQQENVDEIISGDAFDSIRRLLPHGIDVRFKFAHGYQMSYLVDEDRLKQAVKQISARSKSTYLEQMLREGYFTYEGVAKGLPVKSKISEFQNRGFKCRAIGATLLIDSNAEVYPCCYLFDDNVGNSPYRNSTVPFSIGADSVRW